MRTFESVDVLVNNAGMGSIAESGIGGPGEAKAVVDFDDRFWELTLRVNLTVPYKLCRKVLPGMIQRRYGRIIFIASISAFRPGVHDVAYAASKSGLLGLMRTIAREHAKDGITSNAICPGTTATRTADRRMTYEAERLGKSLEQVNAGISPLGRRLEPDEIAPIAIYLASPAAAAATGQTFVIDGGQLNS
jgi:NAD(P)-dependent dehydrogenase (short-subunit alcohol dehydrogenase family)